MKFTVGDATYHYEVTGEGRPIVLLHGFTGSHHSWSSFISEWQDGFQLITIDLPGHGKTSTNTPRTMEACCHDLQQLFEHLALTSFHLVGYSMGGRVALSFAILFPQYISSLTLESSSPGLRSKDEQRQRIKRDEKLARKIETEGLEAFVDFWESIPLFASQRRLGENQQQSIRAERLSQTEKGLTDSLRHMGTGSQPSWWEKLAELTQPVLLIVGELDEKFVNINQAMEKLLPKVELTIVENAGHAIHVEEPEKFGKLIIAFILKHSAQGGY